MIVSLLLFLFQQQGLLLPLLAARTHAHTWSYHLDIVGLQPNHCHLVESVGWKWLVAVKTLSKPGLIRMELGIYVYEAVCTDERVVFGKNGIEVTRH